MSNPSLVLNKIDDITFEELPAPKIESPNDVLVEVKKTGICGSDIHYYAHGRIGDFVLTKPMVLGHESAGTVVEVGSAVTKVKVGDNVAIEPGVPSRLSVEYKRGQYNLCPHMCFAATPNSTEGEPNPPGTLCRLYRSPEDFLVPLPDTVSLELGAMVEPLSVGVHACRQAKVQLGDNVVVFGAGPVGLLAAAVATTIGAKKVMVVDVFDTKLETALKVGVANAKFNSRTGDFHALREAFGAPINVVLECTGAEPCINMGIKCLSAGGRYTQVGNASGDVKFPIIDFATRELTMYGSFRYGVGDYQMAVDILEKNYRQGRDKAPINFEALITNRFSWDDAIKAYDYVRAGHPGTIKAIIDGPGSQ
ncbi:hypothetical protein DIURU_002347 [Diutina rugosa]|uniref:Enoyl reductase (ER) domain-containing protein n=1 Tax=Diutina rugosa TaxID=5481 RepID=A0A642UQ75_DIURU|nr:uncharacterized protein DIURU_002347 [Diutina rugosa]KAA8903461.1 hypothetical protein DIURU_002347 [Diutina rugosa]